MIFGNHKADCRVYVACKMTGRDKREMIQRAREVCDVFRYYGLTPISPVIEEAVKYTEGALVDVPDGVLRRFWRRDKEIISREAHVIYFDHAEMKSQGMEREYGFARYCLFKPCVVNIPKGTPASVAAYEDDLVVKDLWEAGSLIKKAWGTPRKRRLWRLRMLVKSFPTWIIRQLYQWR